MQGTLAKKMMTDLAAQADPKMMEMLASGGGAPPGEPLDEEAGGADAIQGMLRDTPQGGDSNLSQFVADHLAQQPGMEDAAMAFGRKPGPPQRLGGKMQEDTANLMDALAQPDPGRIQELPMMVEDYLTKYGKQIQPQQLLQVVAGFDSALSKLNVPAREKQAMMQTLKMRFGL